MTRNVIIDFFSWWNEAMADPARLTGDKFTRFFTPDGRLVVNGRLRAAGPEALALHYRGIADRHGAVFMALPVEREFGDRVHAFVHCRTRKPDDDGIGQEAMAYAVLEDSRMALLRVIQAC